MNKLAINILPGRYAVCRMTPDRELPDPPAGAAFWSITIAPDEISLVCSESDIPLNAKIEAGWRIMGLAGQLDFNQVGIIAGVSTTLADAKISLFTISTFNTDYFLIKESDLGAATNALRASGYQIGATKPLS